MRQELELAKAEVKQEATTAGKAAGMLGAAGFAGYMTLLFASIALWWALANGMDEGWAALIVAVLWGIAAAVLAIIGKKRMASVRAQAGAHRADIEGSSRRPQGPLRGRHEQLPERDDRPVHSQRRPRGHPARHRGDQGRPEPRRRRPDREGQPGPGGGATSRPGQGRDGLGEGEGDGQSTSDDGGAIGSATDKASSVDLDRRRRRDLGADRGSAEDPGQPVGRRPHRLRCGLVDLLAAPREREGEAGGSPR